MSIRNQSEGIVKIVNIASSRSPKSLLYSDSFVIESDSKVRGIQLRGDMVWTVYILAGIF
jgi:hypothetical protein